MNMLRAKSDAAVKILANGRRVASDFLKRRILIIDDEQAHTSILSELLADRYEVLTANDGESGLRLAQRYLPDLVLLDVRLPRQSGLAVCSALRGNQETRDIPIIVMTGHDNQEARTTAYRMGADDYLSKPFALDEVLARIESKIRRLDEQQSPRQQVTLGNLAVDREKMEASIDGVSLMLSALEFRLLEYFVEHCEKILSRERILEDIWKNAVVTPRTVDTHVSFLRKKLSRSTYAIRTLYGAGYILKPRDGSSASDDSDEEV
jgi:two-component system alkaline phosphatase synthesis response regulator PhoP